MTDILDRTDRSLRKIPKHGGSKSKREWYRWSDPGQPGTLKWVDKYALHVDGRYQREMVSENKVRDLAASWNWLAYQPITVVQRADGSLWVLEGGQRVRAALRRDDVPKLPAWVHEVGLLEQEAAAFEETNRRRTTVDAFHNHRALVVAKDAVAIEVDAIVRSVGYEVVAGQRPYGFQSVRALERAVKTDPQIARDVMVFLASLAEDGEPITKAVLEGTFYAARALRPKHDILSGRWATKLAAAGLGGLNAACTRHAQVVGQGGQKICAQAILGVLNKGARKKLSFDLEG